MSDDVPEPATDPKGPSEIDLHLGRRLRRRRRLLGLTQTDLAEKVGIKFQQIQKYECGANRITAARLHQLAVALEVDTNYFYDGMDSKFNSKASAASLGELSREEINLLKAFRKANPKAQRAFIDLMSAGPSPDEQ